MRVVVLYNLSPLVRLLVTGLVWLWLGDIFVPNPLYAQSVRLTSASGKAIVQLLSLVGPGKPDSTRLLPHLDSAYRQAVQRHDEYLAAYCQLLQLRCRLAYAPPLAEGEKLFKAAYPPQPAYRFAAIEAGYWHVYGQYLLEQHQFESSFRYLLRAQQQFQRLGWANLPDAIDYLYGMGSLYFRFGDYHRAIHYLKLAEQYRPAQPLPLRTVVLNTLGLAYQNVRNYSQATRQFQVALSQARQTGDSAYLGIVSGNLGNTLRLQGRLRASLPYLYQDLTISQRLVPENAATTCLYLASVLLTLDSTAKAKTYIDYSTRLLAGQPKGNSYQLNYAQVQDQYARKTGQLRAALEWADAASAIQDSLQSRFDRTLLLATEQRLQAQQYLAHLHLLDNQRIQAERLRNGSLLALLLLSLASWYALRQKTIRQRQQQQLAAERLAAASAQLDQYVASLRAKNEWIAHITDQLDQVQQHASEVVPDTTEPTMRALLKSVILTEADWQQFRFLFERVHPGFFARLSQQTSVLTSAEVRLLALSRLRLPTKEMGIMLGITTEAVRKGRYRLRKKLSMASADSSMAELLAYL